MCYGVPFVPPQNRRVALRSALVCSVFCGFLDTVVVVVVVVLFLFRHFFASLHSKWVSVRVCVNM